jgi:hypothetical protein
MLMLYVIGRWGGGVALVTLPLLLLCLPCRRPASQPQESAWVPPPPGLASHPPTGPPPPHALLPAPSDPLLPSALGAAAAQPPPKEGYTQPRPEIGNPGTGLLPPPSLYARAGHHIEKFVYTAFIVGGVPALNHPPCLFFPKIFSHRKSGREAVVIVAAGDGSGWPLAP